MPINTFVLLSVLILTACGFSPIYATNNASAKHGLNNVEIAIIPDRSGQFLRNALIDRFYHNGYPVSPNYKLVVESITEKIFDFDITVEAEATRQQIKLTTQMMLVDIETEEAVLTRSLVAVTSNNILESEFSTIITEQSARDAALSDLARQIERQLSLYFSQNK
jgi:LPS-assembly lipoprotein